jgi:hypothetical protein
MSSQASDELSALARDTHAQASAFLLAVSSVASGDEPDYALSVLILETTQLALAGGRLAALADIEPHGRFEADAGRDVELDGFREGLRRLLGDLDVYNDVVDPLHPERGTTVTRVSDELAVVAADLFHGLQHYAAGRVVEALWWWQFSYLATWGSALTSAMRALQSLVAHTRLDAELPMRTAGTIA